MQPQKSGKKTKRPAKQGGIKAQAAVKRSRGRPATGRVATQIIAVRVSPAEKASLEALAAAAGLSVHAYVRGALGLS